MVLASALLARLPRSNVADPIQLRNTLRLPVRRVRLGVAIALGVMACAGLAVQQAGAQANPSANTFSTLAGGYAGTYTVGGVCGGATSGSKYTAIDTYGNGCPLTQAILGPSLSGIGVDGAGNIFVEDYSNGQVRKIDAKSGIVSKVIGTNNTVCSTTASATGTKQDALGSGCVNTSALGPATARGMNVDPWGNVILASYNSNSVNVVCLATSPLCPNTTGRKQVGSFYRVAGCIATQGGSATAATTITAYSGGDNSPASPYQNLAGDVTAWGLTGAAATAATVGTAGTCSSSVGGVDNARNAQGDKYGNVYIADTSADRYRVVLGPPSFNGVTNPLFAIINLNPKYTATEGFIYTILGSFTTFTSGSITYNIPTAAGGACTSAAGSALATDTLGDGCAFFETGKPAAATTPAGLGVDKDGNPIFSDTQDSAVRVMYVGGTTMANIISLNNSGITPVVGTVYAIEGTGTATKSGTPALNVGSSSISTGNTKVAVDGQGNIYTSDGTGFNIIDSVTGYLRRPISSGGTLCTGGASNGDGCPAGQGQSWTSLSSVGTAVTVDNLGNLLFADSTGRVRKVLAGALYPTAVGSTFTQTVVFHEPAGTTGVTVALLNASPGITIPVTAPTCTLYNTASDNTADCKVSVTFAPTVAGKVGATLAVTNVGASGATTLYPLVGVATDATLVTDTATPTTATFSAFATGALPTSLAVDTGGNFYTIDNHTATVKQISSAGTVTTVGTAPANANQVAVDTTGNVYVTAVGATSVTRFTLVSAGSYTSSTITSSSVAKPQGIAVDAQGNLYLSDATTTSVYEIPNNTGYAALQAPTVVASGFANPTLLTFDASGNLLVADTATVYRVNASTGASAAIAASAATAGAVTLSGLTPVGLAADAGNNVYIQDAASKNVFEIPYQTFAPGSVAVLSGETTPSGIALDGLGNLYAADSGLATPAIVKVSRAAETYTFPTATTTYSGIFTNIGNANSTGYAQTDSAEFPYTGTGSGGCGTISGTSVLTTGAACTFTVTPNLGNNGQLVTNTTTLLPTTSLGSLALTAQEATGVTYTTTTSVSGPSTAVYLATGTEATFAISEIGSDSSTQTGLVQVSIDSAAATNYSLTNGAASVPLSGLIVGSHTIVATYPGNGTYLTSTSTTTTFTITQASTTVSWTPTVTTQQYSAAVGLSVLNATATSSGTTVPGAFLYTATPSSGPSVFIHSASYLAIGTYSLSVTFVPTDAVDFAQSTASVASYAVTKASTSAPVGTTQTLVAADGTGNYTTVQAAVNALPSGGSIYIKPGTYTGDVSVVQPNVAFRGLGGDPTKVILTHAGGAFGGSGVYAYAGEFNVSMENGYQLPTGSTQFTGDEGSATLVVAKGINTALSTSTTIPNNFYGENFTLLNTYDTDTSTTTTTYLPSANSGTCTANEGPAQTYNYLFNNSLLCASQALAIWTTSDLSVMNNVYTASLQDTIYTASQGSGSNGYVPARQYWFRGKVTGTVDYIFGDSAAVFDYSSIYTVPHGTGVSGTATIEAQNKASQTGASNDYLSGYVMNSDVFTSQTPGMTSLYLGRPYGTYSTWIMLNDSIDQVAPAGYTTGLGPTFADVTYTEFNDILYTDPATNALDANGVTYLGTGGSSGSGVTGPREALSTNPGTPMANNNPPTSMTQAQAQAFFPTNFLSQTVSSLLSSTQNWIPTAAIAADVNAFVPSGTSATVASGASVTILMRPQTPGLGAVTNGVYTIPTGTYTLTDSYNGGANYTVASGTLDASGEAYFTSSTLSAGTHNLTWTYSGDSNFAGSTTSSAYVLTINGGSATTTTTTVAVTASPIIYGQSASITANVAATSGTATGTVTLTIDGSITQTATLSGGTATFTVSGLTAANHSVTASYAGNASFAASSSTAPASVVVSPAPLTVTAACTARIFDQAISCSATVTGSYQYSDTVTSVFTAIPAGVTAALRSSPSGLYTATPVYTLTTFGSTNYAVTAANGTFNITGGAPQTIIFSPLPNFASGGTYQLTARSTSGLPVSYAVTAGTASVSGSTLTVSGPGLVTIQATQATDPTGDYAAATPVSRSFTAQ